MINYKRCSDVNIEALYEAFMTGFSDYIMKVEISMDYFVKHFFGPEGNDLKYSHIAFDGEKPVGLILGGIKNYEGIKTLRCGALCVHPEYRGKGISQKLFEHHREVGISNNCKQLSLEVIVGNNRAINFYKKLGYNKIYDLRYFTLKDVSKIKKKTVDLPDIKKISIQEIKTLENYIYDIHINWQNDFDYIQKVENEYQYGVYTNGSLIGALSINESGNIHFLWVLPKYRNQKIATNLIGYAVSQLGLNKLFISFPNNISLESFIKKMNFEKNELEQYEMYLIL